MTDIILTAKPFSDNSDEHYTFVKGIDFCCETMVEKFFDGEISIKNRHRYPILRPNNLPLFITCPFCGHPINVVAKRPDGARYPLEFKTVKKNFEHRTAIYYEVDPELVWKIESGEVFLIKKSSKGEDK